jgi:hypothetical protein
LGQAIDVPPGTDTMTIDRQADPAVDGSGMAQVGLEIA